MYVTYFAHFRGERSTSRTGWRSVVDSKRRCRKKSCRRKAGGNVGDLFASNSA